jgi:hypothetical protein
MNTPQPTAPTQRISVSTALFNPSYYLAGGPALAIGLAVLLATGLIGFFAHTHVDGVLDIHTGREAPMWVHLGESLIDWIAMALPLYIAGRILSKSRVRAVDVLGTQATARFPYLVATLMTLLPAYQRHLVVVMEQVQRVQNGEGVGAIAASAASQPVDSDLLVFLLVTVFNLLMLAWMIALMYRSYAYTTNMKGARPIVSFIVVLIIAEAVSKIGVQALFILVRP